jgi:fumarylacetoacetate (FAA) hydrolase family protein
MTPTDRLDAYIASLSDHAVLIGRIDLGEGPLPIRIQNGEVFDLSGIAPTIADLLAANLGRERGAFLSKWTELQIRPAYDSADRPHLLCPVDLQCIKGAGVTFALSALERVIEEKAGGDPASAQSVRMELAQRIGADLSRVSPGSHEAQLLKTELKADGLWSQYLEVALGPDAEIFTKAPVLASVGWGDYVGIRPDSRWNNPEPEVVIVCTPDGTAVGATLGNDVNLRDIEGRSALLLGKAKDNNAACSIGPFIRMFDAYFGLQNICEIDVNLEISGEDGFSLRGSSSMRQISRSPQDLINQTFGPNHAYPDGFALFLGTMFAPTQDRDAAGQGFTHHIGDHVRIWCTELGDLENRVELTGKAPPWEFGIRSLYANLAHRGMLPDCKSA